MRVKIFISVSQTLEEGFLFFHDDVTIQVARFGGEIGGRSICRRAHLANGAVDK